MAVDQTHGHPWDRAPQAGVRHWQVSQTAYLRGWCLHAATHRHIHGVVCRIVCGRPSLVCALEFATGTAPRKAPQRPRVRAGKNRKRHSHGAAAKTRPHPGFPGGTACSGLQSLAVICQTVVNEGCYTDAVHLCVSQRLWMTENGTYIFSASCCVLAAAAVFDSNLCTFEGKPT